jgi:multisubunit Na+/H+ antiporter MnhB subunit
MSRLYRIISFAFWALGLITTIATVVCRLMFRLRVQERVEIRSLLWLAGVFFLGAIATFAMERAAKD